MNLIIFAQAVDRPTGSVAATCETARLPRTWGMRLMAWSFPLCRLFGVRLDMHVTFLFLLAYAAWQGASEGGAMLAAYPGWVRAVWWVFLVLAMFTCVVLHEFGHIFAARRYGVGTRRILLLPVGGMAEMDRIPRQPGRELVVTIAGPAVNFVIAALGFLGLWLSGVWEGWATFDRVLFPFDGVGFFAFLVLFNTSVGLFNLVPVYPMDGGRIVRSLLATRVDYMKATRWAVWLAKPLAVVGVLLGLYLGSWTMALLFSFIYIAGEMEYEALRRDEARHDLRMADVAATHWREVPEGATLGEALAQLRREQVPELILRREGRLAVALTAAGLRKLAEAHPASMALGDLALSAAPVAMPWSPVEAYLHAPGKPGPERVLVMHNGELVGIFRAEALDAILGWQAWEKKLASPRRGQRIGLWRGRAASGPPPLPSHEYARGNPFGPGRLGS